jgi:VWFA-related protein
LTKKLLASLIAVLVSLSFLSPASAADRVNIQIMAVEEQPGQMVLTVSAVDERGKPFPGLDVSSFNAWIDDKPLIVKGVQAETARLPASVLLLVDVSGSMAGDPMNQARAAIQTFIDELDSQDQVAVMSFASRVQLLQDFTTDRNALAGAVGSLTPVGETALYDGVIQAAQHMAGAPAGRKLIVLLSDGLATVGTNNRALSIQTTQASNVGVVAVGLGSGIDRNYLAELTTASGGRFLEASTPAVLKQAYVDLASAIRSQYTLQVSVPRSIDRTVPGRLKVHVIYRADNAFAERSLEALPGALPPPFSVELSGLKPGDKPSGVISLIPAVQDGIEVVKLDYFVDDNVIRTTDNSTVAFDLDTSSLATGGHVLKVVATDAAGREGEVQVPFIVPEVVAAGGSTSLPIIPLAVLALLAAIALVVHKFLWKRIVEIVRGGDVYESRVSSWASIRTSGPVTRPEEWPERPEPKQSPEPSSRDPIRGRVVIMDEAAVRSGALDSIREYEMRSSPLTFGSGPGVDIRVDDVGGLIAAEEARIWVQRGRLVYHKLTTLTAMATEGVTAGWQFLEDGDEMRIGPYRLLFQAQIEEQKLEEIMPLPDHLPQEHGMALRPTGTDDPAVRGFSTWVSDFSSDQTPPARPSLHDFNTPGQDGSYGMAGEAGGWGASGRSAQWRDSDEPLASRLEFAPLEDSEWDGGQADARAPAWGQHSDWRESPGPEASLTDPPADVDAVLSDDGQEAASLIEGDKTGEPTEGAGWKSAGEEEFTSWQSGEWTLDADEEDEAD